MSGAALPAALVLGVDRPATLAIVRELGRRGVTVVGIGSDLAAAGRASRYLEHFALRPEGPINRWLPGLMADMGAEVALGIGERDLVALRAAGGAIDGCRILAPPAEAVEAVLDKRRTMAIAESLGIDVPRSWQPAAPGEDAPDLGWPVVVKWPNPPAVKPVLERLGLPFVKAEYCIDAPALRRLLARYAAVGQLPLVQERVPGRGLGQMIYMHEGRAVLRFQHERLHEWPAEGGVSSLCRAVPLHLHAGQMEKSEALLRAIGWDGPAMVEYRYDPDSGRYVLMEVNGRFWGSQPLATACGAEFGWELYRRQVLGENDPAPAPRTDLSARHMIRETKRLARLVAGRHRSADPLFRPTPLADFARYAAGFVNPRTRYYLLSLDDPMPFVADVAGRAGGVARRLAGRLRLPRRRAAPSVSA